MEQIRVSTFDGPGAKPLIRTVPWPDIPKRAALIKVGESSAPEKTDPAELAAMTAVANVLLNLNETITK